MTAILIIALVGAAFHYLSSHALITHWLWSRYPPLIDKLLSCAACSGLWLGLGLAWLLADRGYPILGVQGDDPFYFVLSACAGLVLVPIAATLQLAALKGIQDAGHDDGPQEQS